MALTTNEETWIKNSIQTEDLQKQIELKKQEIADFKIIKQTEADVYETEKNAEIQDLQSQIDSLKG
jgi:hypothetical protein